MSDILKTLSKQMIPAVEAEMQAVLGVEDKDESIFQSMMHYHMGWIDEQFRPLEGNGGKRIRPLLCLLTCMAADGDWHQAIPAAAALELTHNFTLIHDDIQDASPTRRGRRTLWKIWGKNQAINSGDAMFALAHLALIRLTTRGVADGTTVRALRMLDETCLELTMGQYADMSFEERAEVSVSEYLEMIQRKTAALLSLSTKFGAIVAACSADVSDHYATFGRDLGMAFQIRDDILGIWGDESLIGKSAATDIATRKKSLPVLYGLAESEELRSLYSQNKSGVDFVDRVVRLLDDVGAREFAERHEREYANSAIEHLKAVNPRGDAGSALLKITGRLLNRQF